MQLSFFPSGLVSSIYKTEVSCFTQNFTCVSSYSSFSPSAHELTLLAWFQVKLLLVFIHAVLSGPNDADCTVFIGLMFLCLGREGFDTVTSISLFLLVSNFQQTPIYFLSEFNHNMLLYIFALRAHQTPLEIIFIFITMKILCKIFWPWAYSCPRHIYLKKNISWRTEYVHTVKFLPGNNKGQKKNNNLSYWVSNTERKLWNYDLIAEKGNNNLVMHVVRCCC